MDGHYLRNYHILRPLKPKEGVISKHFSNHTIFWTYKTRQSGVSFICLPFYTSEIIPSCRYNKNELKKDMDNKMTNQEKPKPLVSLPMSPAGDTAC